MHHHRTEGKSDPPSRVAPVIARAPLPMVEVEGPKHTVCFVNSAFCLLLGKTSADLVGRSFGEIVRNGERCLPLLDRVYETGQAGMQVEADDFGAEPALWLFAMWPALGKDAKPERVVIQLTRTAHAKTIAEMNEALMLGALRQHELRESFEQSNVRLQLEIAERKTAGAALSEAMAQLKEAQVAAERGSRAKDDFLAALSHELRTPLTPVMLTAALLREDTTLSAETREKLGMIERNIGLEARLIDDLLDLTKISHGKLEFRPEWCDAHRLIMLAVEIVRADATAKEVSITCNLHAPCTGLNADPTRFQQVIWNLLRNAVKFTPMGGKVTVSTANENGAADGPWLRIEITDSGIGIPPERLQQIFMPFDQGGLTGDHRFGGVGLGLAIARSVVELHGGKVRAMSEGANRGATLIVELPGAKALTQPAAGQAAVSTPLTKNLDLKAAPVVRSRRLLVVEDHASTLQALRGLLQKDGHHVTTATTIAAARAAAATETFDLVISDLGLPDGNGTDLMRELRAHHPVKGIALSGYGMDEDIERSAEAGFVAHLTKPVAIADLRRVIASLSREDPPAPAAAADAGAR